jgi:hypothetical protein
MKFATLRTQQAWQTSGNKRIINVNNWELQAVVTVIFFTHKNNSAIFRI